MAGEEQPPGDSASISPRQLQKPLPKIRFQPPLPQLQTTSLQIPYRNDAADSPSSIYSDDSYLTPNSALRHYNHTKQSTEGSPSGLSENENVVGEMRGPPPDYEPMHDYFRSLALQRQQRPANLYSPSSNTFLSPSSRPQTPNAYSPYTPYRDTPASAQASAHLAVAMGPLSARTPTDPPSYEELYLQHPCPEQQSRLMELVRQMDEADATFAEEVCKFVIGVVFIVLTVVVVGFMFNWGRPLSPSVVTASDQASEPPRLVIHGSGSLCGGRCPLPT